MRNIKACKVIRIFSFTFNVFDVRKLKALTLFYLDIQKFLSLKRSYCRSHIHLSQVIEKLFHDARIESLLNHSKPADGDRRKLDFFHRKCGRRDGRQNRGQLPFGVHRVRPVSRQE